MCGWRTNLELDDRVLAEAVKIGGQTTKKAAVTEALQEYIARRKQLHGRGACEAPPALTAGDPNLRPRHFLSDRLAAEEVHERRTQAVRRLDLRDVSDIRDEIHARVRHGDNASRQFRIVRAVAIAAGDERSSAPPY